MIMGEIGLSINKITAVEYELGEAFILDRLLLIR